MEQKGKMRFIRKNGRIIPIKENGPSDKQKISNYKKHGDGANQASRIEHKINAKATDKKVIAAGFASIAGLLGSTIAADRGSVKGAIAGSALFLGASIYGHARKRKNLENLQTKKENEYVKAFGVGSDGEKIQEKRKKAMKKMGR